MNALDDITPEALNAPTQTGPWNTNEPPKDGTAIVVIGRVISRDEFSTCVDSFVAAVRWVKDESEYEGWHFAHSGMVVARTLEDEVKVDWWAHFPN
jgi:hypothetical protein